MDIDPSDEKAVQELMETHAELGAWRNDGPDNIKVLCGFCKMWCDAVVTVMSPIPISSVGCVVYAADPSDTVVQLHVELKLHVHHHECTGRDVLLRS